MAGFPGAVAPLGTALTEEQLGMLWKMSEEPMLCFDGDSAGRAPPIAPSIWRCRSSRPARSCCSRCCRTGRTPTISMPLRRHDGDDRCARRRASARATCCGSARPKAGASIRRSAAPDLKRGFNQVTAVIANETVRKYYRQDLEARVRELFAPQGARNDQRARRSAIRAAAIRAAMADGADARGGFRRPDARQSLVAARARG